MFGSRNLKINKSKNDNCQTLKAYCGPGTVFGLYTHRVELLSEEVLVTPFTLEDTDLEEPQVKVTHY